MSLDQPAPVQDISRYRLAPGPERDVRADGARIARRWLAHRERLHARLQWSREQIESHQFERISALVEWAFACNPFYREKYRAAGFRSGELITWSDYLALPCVTKDELVSHGAELASWSVSPPSDVYLSRTSGSSGRTVTVRQNNPTSDAGALFYLRNYELMLGRPRRETELLYEIYLAPPRYQDLDGRWPVLTIDNLCPPELALVDIRARRPAILCGFPSYLLELAALAGGRERLGIGAICTNSESSTQQERDRIAAGLGARVHDEYSSEELYLIATQCGHGRYHVVEDNVRLDTVGPTVDGVSEVACTSLVNGFWPLIRYRQGDSVALADENEQCACGNRFRMLDRFCGRADESLLNRRGDVVRSDRIMTLYDRTLIPRESGVGEFRLIQREPRRVDLLVAREDPGTPISQAAVEDFIAGLRDLFGDPGLEIGVDLVNAMPETGSFKRRLIMNRIVGPVRATP